ncbi:hypothetical protein [Ornithinibacillus halophilus]|uniref:Uncharacterized protein n=1 Tax=Ornithinibacillus halophilus TaxID=930117 RepID=A0A1M5NQS2_9BACI|nr:hypothetical protein [Ornithinibacillus halophilus]SHG91828.1 hypothetical protein SAMN05216225_10874 [Ornithinibacillus halophilus]
MFNNTIKVLVVMAFAFLVSYMVASVFDSLGFGTNSLLSIVLIGLTTFIVFFIAIGLFEVIKRLVVAKQQNN